VFENPRQIPYDLRALRRYLQLTQLELARLVGVHSVTVSRWESGLARPNWFQISLLREYEKAWQRYPPIASHIAETIWRRDGPMEAIRQLLNAARRKSGKA